MSKFKNHKLLFQNNKIYLFLRVDLHVVNNALFLLFFIPICLGYKTFLTHIVQSVSKNYF